MEEAAAFINRLMQSTTRWTLCENRAIRPLQLARGCALRSCPARVTAPHPLEAPDTSSLPGRRLSSSVWRVSDPESEYRRRTMRPHTMMPRPDWSPRATIRCAPVTMWFARKRRGFRRSRDDEARRCSRRLMFRRPSDDNGAAARDGDDGSAAGSDDDDSVDHGDDCSAARSDDDGSAAQSSDDGSAARSDDNGAAARDGDDGSAA